MFKGKVVIAFFGPHSKTGQQVGSQEETTISLEGKYATRPWVKISENGNIIRIAACYFAPQVSKTYKSRGLDHKDPFAALKNNIAMYFQLSEILIVGDFNARTACEQASILRCKEDYNPIWLTEERNH
jgi:hypothetical protein